MSNMPSPSPISTDSEYDGRSSSQADEVTDRRLKPTTDDRVADRRRRNGESAKRSREKRKKFLNEMEENYGTLLESNKSLQDENKRLRELLASVGVDASFPPVQVKDIAPIPELLSSHKTAKRVKRECRVTPTANSFESEDTQNPSPQLENNPLAVATTVLLLTCCQMATSMVPWNEDAPLDSTPTTLPTLQTSTSILNGYARTLQINQKTCGPNSMPSTQNLTSRDLCSTNPSHVTDGRNIEPSESVPHQTNLVSANAA
eukprot:TRINITY_DN1918_c0_g1_i1.p1 TRINITY_DN1918_c0_g1~~TRINITY_DN1918_c0_g1_i1.p1  ORF type:complete len:260 (+),score=17.18 TRINITY_DN1918_c0_g1_i1:207-986(+)